MNVMRFNSPVKAEDTRQPDSQRDMTSHRNAMSTLTSPAKRPAVFGPRILAPSAAAAAVTHHQALQRDDADNVKKTNNKEGFLHQSTTMSSNNSLQRNDPMLTSVPKRPAVGPRILTPSAAVTHQALQSGADTMKKTDNKEGFPRQSTTMSSDNSLQRNDPMLTSVAKKPAVGPRVLTPSAGASTRQQRRPLGNADQRAVNSCKPLNYLHQQMKKNDDAVIIDEMDLDDEVLP